MSDGLNQFGGVDGQNPEWALLMEDPRVVEAVEKYREICDGARDRGEEHLFDLIRGPLIVCGEEFTASVPEGERDLYMAAVYRCILSTGFTDFIGVLSDQKLSQIIDQLRKGDCGECSLPEFLTREGNNLFSLREKFSKACDLILPVFF